jgi:uncharacterized protein
MQRPRRPHAASAKYAQGDAAVSGESLWQALAMVLVIEGLLPFISPKGWRSAFQKILMMTDGQIRFFGLCSMAIGLIALVLLM